MKFFSLFNGGKKAKKTKDVAAEVPAVDSVSSTSSLSSGTSSKHKSHKKKNHGNKDKKSKTQVDSDPTAAIISSLCKKAHEFMHSMNTVDNTPADPQAAYLEEFYSYFESENSPIYLEDGEKYKTEACGKLLWATHLSFPDFKFAHVDVHVEGVKDISSKTYIKVTVDGIYASGTHTGLPYTIMPGVLPAIPTSGKYMCNDEQIFVFHMHKETGKIKRVDVVALGNCTGFSGLYTRAGGDLSNIITTNEEEPAAPAPTPDSKESDTEGKE